MLLFLIAPVYAATPWLHTDANKIKDPDGNVVVLRGLDTIDLGAVELSRGGAINLINRLTNTNDPCGSSPGWYPRVIRLAVYPSQEGDFHSPFTFTPGNDDYYNQLLRPVVDYCKTKDLYVIIDWHFVGDNTYDKVTETSQFWEYMAPRFADDSHVLFELFQEPLNTSGSTDAADWLSCRPDMQRWINIVRTYAPNNLILVSGPSWSQEIGPAADYPLDGDNIVMVAHIYPGHWLGGYQWWYTNHIDHCLTRYPVFMSEWGFRASSSYANLQGTISNYGQPLSDFREARKISGSAWITDYSWEPQMFNTGWGLLVGPNEMGGFTKDLLYLKRNDDQPSNGDSIPPGAPTGPAATAGDGMVSLNWDDNGESDLYGYDIYRSTTSGSGYSRVNLVRTKDPNYTDTNAINGTTYYYVVTAIDTSFNESDASDEVSAMPRDMTPPSVPAGLMATPGNGLILLDWIDDNESDLNGYNVYRSAISGSGYVKLNVSLLSGSNYTDSNVVNNTTYYYVVTAVDTSTNESGYSSEVSATPSADSFVVYNFVGTIQPDANYNAYACDVDIFPFGGSSANRNTMVEANDREYISISTNDTTEWAAVNPGSGDQTLLWLEMKTNESPSNIARIDFTFNGNTGGSGAVTHRIYVLKAGADWTSDTSWVQVGSDQSITPGVDTAMTRAITSNISTYIDGTGKIVWAVYETTSAQVMHTNYLQMTVVGSAFTNNPPRVAVTSPSSDAVLAKGANITIEAGAFDGDGNVTKVEFYQGTTKLGEDTNAPYSYAWNYVPAGYYTLTAVATDDDNAIQTSLDVNITVLGVEGTGVVLCERWTGIPGTQVSNLTSDVNYPRKPTVRGLLLKMEGPTNWSDNYGTRIRGYLYPPADGNYTFWIASDESSELWLSPDTDPCHISKIAYVTGSTNPREWNKNPSQQSLSFLLDADQIYYIEVLHKEGTGNDNIAVAWQGPGLSQRVIDGLYLSPYCLDFRDFARFAVNWRLTNCNAGNSWCNGADFNHDGAVLLYDVRAFAESWLAGI
jgi:fibronectin type 3 domain-containing protein